MVRLLGLTGPIACGKSSVSRLLAESGEAPVTSFTSLPGLHSDEKTLTGSIHVNSVNSLSSSFFLLELPGWPVVDADQIAHQILADPTGLVV
jgi:dephospho-CoA kinase